MEPLSEHEIAERMGTLGPAWRREGEALVADREGAGFTEVIELVNRIAAEAERADHHPDLLIHGYRRLRITLTTHAASGLTDRDFALAGAIDAL